MNNLADHIRGDTWMGVTVNLQLNSAPVDLTGASIAMQVRKCPDRPPVAIEWSTASEDITIVDADSGQFRVEPKIIDVAVGDYYYDIQVILADGRVLTVVQGKWKITFDVTR